MSGRRRGTAVVAAGVIGLLAGALGSAGAAPTGAKAAVARAVLPLAVAGDRPAAAAPTGLGPQVINRVYGLHPGGAGQVIMVVTAYHDTTAAHDLSVFSRQYGLPQLPACRAGVALNAQHCFEVVDPQGTPGPLSGSWPIEDAIDTEWAHAEAPRATIVMVEALDDEEYAPRAGAPAPHLVQAAAWAGAHGASEVSMSWGLPALGNNFDAYAEAFDNPAVHYIASAGDFGSLVFWPAESERVLAVGGTTLEGCTGTTCAPEVDEVAWSGSGGGVSSTNREPGVQRRYTGHVYHATSITALTGHRRGVPDVSFLADEANGVSIYESAPTPPDGDSGWLTVGGTSVGAPVWAAVVASGAAAGATALQSPGAIYSYGYRSNLYDVRSGTNGSCGTVCTAGPGYDLVTGLGSPRNYP